MKNNIYGNILTNHKIIFSVILLLNLLIFFSFINGFLYPRQGITNKSEDLEVFCRKVFGDDYVESLKKKNSFSIINAPYDRIVLLLIDSLRFDFMLYDPNYKKEERENEDKDENGNKKDKKNELYGEKLFLNNMMNLHHILKKEKKNSLLFRFEADPPTITTSRLKSILIGSVPNYMDINENFNPSSNIQDNFFEQLHRNKKNTIVIGDDTITRLSRNFKKELVYESFNIFDFYSLDIASKKHFYEEYVLDYWDLIYIHVLAVDHAGHVEGPNSKSMSNILKDFDMFIYDIINKIKLEKEKRTLFLVIGDHGQMDSGDHGGSSTDETESALFAYSPMDFISLNKNINQNNFILYDNDSAKNHFLTNNSQINIEGYKKYHSFLNNINKNDTYYYNIKHTKQLNLISTLSLLIGSTLPFCNIGNVILDMIPVAYINKHSKLKKKENKESKVDINTNENFKNNTNNKNDDLDSHSNLYYDLLNLHYIAELNYANLWQINRYLNFYEKKYRVLKNKDYFFIKSTWTKIEEEKSHFFIAYKNFVDDETILRKEQIAYIEYINKMRNLMDFTQKYFYSIFFMKNRSFLILCFFIITYFLIIFKILYYHSKLNYYHNTITKSNYSFIIQLFVLLLPFNSFNKNIYLLLFSCAFLLYFVTHILSKNKYKDFYMFFNYAKISIMFNNSFIYEEETKENKKIKKQDNKGITHNDKKRSINENNNNKFQNFINLIVKYLNKIGTKNTLYNENIEYKVNDHKESKTYIFYNIYNILKLFYIFKSKFALILINNMFFVFVIIWSLSLVSFNYIDKEIYYIHYILFMYVVFCLFKYKNKFSFNFIRGCPLLIILTLNTIFNFTPDFLDHNIEKKFLNKLMLKIVLPVSFYFLSLILINSGINKLLQKKIKYMVMQIWTLQFVLVFLFLLKINEYMDFLIPPFIYILTFSIFIFIILRKNSIIEKKKLPGDIQKLYEVSISLFIILFSSIQLSIIIYSNTNLSVLFLFYITLIFFYFFFLSINSSENNEDNNIVINWINEHGDIKMFNIENKNKNIKTYHINTSIKEKFSLKLEEEKNNILNKCNLVNQTDITQMQIFKLIKNFSFYLINETDFHILSSVLLKYSFFITGHKFIFNKLPINSAYVGLNKYVWPISQFYLFNHIFFPFVFSLFFVVYIYNLRKIKIMLLFKELDFYNFYLYPLINFLFKILFLFSSKFIFSLCASFYLDLHIMLYDYFLPNFFYLTVINILFISFCLLILSITKNILLR
ncbi:GPI ethanolamine phosphate transferase 3, putative [Plasmodium relictum]|uniref:GPI ethanolamine phosphate transferase 3, putative n=1 Tax=Plasmodium relictum TaxID=85471 RepID=A0A1J1HET0_PLARL|nr:GPI ethanolamine phosphate transferase 3, putative [Plasmodium relictum]CRH02570.1 GPI ethanolamine phosphate transferase 3, putative [Plasmodium relictum]